MRPRPSHHATSRRTLLTGVGLLLGSSALRARSVSPASGPYIAEPLVRDVAGACDTRLPPEVVTACEHRILDTDAAIIFGLRMHLGAMATHYVRGLNGVSRGSVGTDPRTTAIDAAPITPWCETAR